MSQIQFFCLKTTTELEKQTGYVTGWKYVTKDRWVQCLPEEATHFRWSAPSSDGMYQKTTNDVIGDDLVDFFKKYTEGKKVITYHKLIEDLILGKGDIIPDFIKGAIKSMALQAHEKHGKESGYCRMYYPHELIDVLEGVIPVYIDESIPLPD